MQTQQKSEAFALLSQPTQFKNLRSNSAQFLNKLASNTNLLKDLLDICFRPRHFEQTKKVVLTPNLPAIAIESLCSLYEDFISLLTYDKIIHKDSALQGFQNEEEPIEKKQEEEKQQFIYLSHIHQAFQDPEGDDASISNLSRILGPIYYQSPEKAMRFYQQHTKEKMLLLNGLWRRSVMQIFCKMMQAESGKQFFKEFKVDHLNKYYSLLLSNLDGEFRHQWLQGLLQLHKFVMEKMEERYDGSKYMALLETMMKNDEELVKILLKKFEFLQSKTVLVCIRWCEECLKKDSSIWGATELRVSVTNLSRKNSMSNNFYSEDSKKRKSFHISSSFLSLLTEFIQTIRIKYIQKHRQSTLHLISYYRVLYFLIKIIQASISQDPQLVSLMGIVNEQLLSLSFEIATCHPNSTPLHNYIKEFIIQCLHLKCIPIQYFFTENNQYMKAMLQWLPRSKNNSKVAFGPQSYHIFQEILKANGDLSTKLINLLGEQKSRREKPIGGMDPRKASDPLRGSNCFSESSEEIIQIQIPSLGSVSSSDRNLVLSSASQNSSLQLSHMISLESHIQQVQPPSIDQNTNK